MVTGWTNTQRQAPSNPSGDPHDDFRLMQVQGTRGNWVVSL
jgi:hypothetical protein